MAFEDRAAENPRGCAMNSRGFSETKTILYETGSPVAVAAQAKRRPAQHPLKTYGSSELFEGSTEVGIEHAGALYRLKITRQGKLILNK
jgi:hemin uptake protein HemP